MPATAGHLPSRCPWAADHAPGPGRVRWSGPPNIPPTAPATAGALAIRCAWAA